MDVTMVTLEPKGRGESKGVGGDMGGIRDRKMGALGE